MYLDSKFGFAKVFKCLRILWCVRILKIRSPLLLLLDVQMNSLFVEENFEMFGSKNNKIKAQLESKHPLVS